MDNLQIYTAFIRSVLIVTHRLLFLYLIVLGIGAFSVSGSISNIAKHDIQSILTQIFPVYGFILGGGAVFIATMLQLKISKTYALKIWTLSGFDQQEKGLSNDMTTAADPIIASTKLTEDDLEDEDEGTSDYNRGFFLRVFRMARSLIEILLSLSVIVFALGYSIYQDILLNLSLMVLVLAPISAFHYFLVARFRKNELEFQVNSFYDLIMRRLLRQRFVALGTFGLFFGLAGFSISFALAPPSNHQVAPIIFSTFLLFNGIKLGLSAIFKWFRFSPKVFANEKFLKLINEI